MNAYSARTGGDGGGQAGAAGLAHTHAESLGEKLRLLAEGLPSGNVTLLEVRDRVGADGLLLLTVFLALVFMVPVQIPGLSVVFGGAIVMVGVCRLRGRPLWLPQRIAHRPMPSEKVRTALTRSLVWLHRLEYVSRPCRLDALASTALSEGLGNCGLILGGLLLMAPIILVPFSNTMPALGVLFLSIGMLRRDGLCMLYGHFGNVATVVYFGSLVLGGHAAFDEWWFHNGGRIGILGR